MYGELCYREKESQKSLQLLQSLHLYSIFMIISLQLFLVYSSHKSALAVSPAQARRISSRIHCFSSGRGFGY